MFIAKKIDFISHLNYKAHFASAAKEVTSYYHIITYNCTVPINIRIVDLIQPVESQSKLHWKRDYGCSRKSQKVYGSYVRLVFMSTKSMLLTVFNSPNTSNSLFLTSEYNFCNSDRLA